MITWKRKPSIAKTHHDQGGKRSFDTNKNPQRATVSQVSVAGRAPHLAGSLQTLVKNKTMQQWQGWKHPLRAHAHAESKAPARADPHVLVRKCGLVQTRVTSQFFWLSAVLLVCLVDISCTVHLRGWLPFFYVTSLYVSDILTSSQGDCGTCHGLASGQLRCRRLTGSIKLRCLFLSIAVHADDARARPRNFHGRAMKVVGYHQI